MWYQKTKWGHAKKQEVGGIKYDSRFEGNYAQELIFSKAAKEINDFQAHVPIDLIVNGYLICKYYVDFKVIHNDGSIEYVETKGVPSREWQIKWKLFEALYSELPDVKLTVVMQGRYKIPRAKKIK